jgi:Pyruvate/2-oxoacid:ferredoxin oxidoreductase delta subunit
MRVTEQNRAIAATRRPVIDATKCVNCKACVDGCPNHAIEEAFDYCCAKCVKYCLVMGVPCQPVRVVIRDERCDGCGVCVSVCSYGAIIF